MRRARKEIRDQAVIAGILGASPVGRLGTIASDGAPMIKPLNFVYLDDAIYFHSALEGEKIDDIRRDDRVCFEVDQPLAFVRGASGNPCAAEYLYRSVIVKGCASLVSDDQERTAALLALMRKYQPEGGFGAFLPEKLRITGVIRIDISVVTGKEDLGKEHHRAALEAVLEQRTENPVVLDP